MSQANSSIMGQHIDQIKYMLSSDQFNTEFTHSGWRPYTQLQVYWAHLPKMNAG